MGSLGGLARELGSHWCKGRRRWLTAKRRHACESRMALGSSPGCQGERFGRSVRGKQAPSQHAQTVINRRRPRLEGRPERLGSRTRESTVAL